MTTLQTQAFNYIPNQPVRIKNISSAYTVTGIDAGVIINCTSGIFTIALSPAATLGAGFNCWVWNNTATATDVITIDPSGTETIDGRSTLIVRRGEGTQIICNGTNWDTGDQKKIRTYADNLIPTGSKPTASGDSAIAIGRQSEATNSGSLAIGNFTVASGTRSTAIGNGDTASPTASGTESLALGARTTASANYSTAIGQNSSAAGSVATSGTSAMALGGSYASGTDSFAAAVADNTSTYGATGNRGVAIGYRAKASATDSVAYGATATASGIRSAAFGNLASATDTGAVCIAATVSGYGATASGLGSVAIGERIEARQRGKYAYGSGAFDAFGDAQSGSITLRAATTNATATVLTSDQGAASTTNQVILPNSSAYAFTGTVIARRQASGGTESAAWKVEGLIRREANAASTTLVASTVTAISNVPGWTLALSADTTNGGLKVEATGAAATNIRWVATVQTSEVTYA
jgi:hypothetical protein